MLFKRAKLELHVFGRTLIHHKVGNPNSNLLIFISNVGGKAVKVRRMFLSVKRGAEDSFEMPCNAYFQNQNDSQSLVFTPFKLKPNEEWGHVTQFCSDLPRLEEKQYRLMEAAIRTNIIEKRVALLNKNEDVSANPEVVAPLLDFFEKRFRWLPGEYELTLTIEAEPASAIINRSFRFTLFESDWTELKARANDYKIGAGVFYHTPNHDGLPVQLVSQ